MVWIMNKAAALLILCGENSPSRTLSKTSLNKPAESNEHFSGHIITIVTTCYEVRLNCLLPHDP